MLKAERCHLVGLGRGRDSSSCCFSFFLEESPRRGNGGSIYSAERREKGRVGEGEVTREGQSAHYISGRFDKY